jgi:UDP-N-acetyl-D-mannosaminuronate dehydrogenase
MFSARRLNDGMGDYVGNQVIKLMNKKGVLVKDSNVLILGFTFKENCPDVRNTKIVDIYHTLEEYTKNITVYDPWANADKVEHEYGVQLTSSSLESLIIIIGFLVMSTLYLKKLLLQFMLIRIFIFLRSNLIGYIMVIYMKMIF